MSYEDLIEGMIDALSGILGAQAVTIAQRIRGLQVDDDGTVIDITDDPVTVVDDLVGAYVDSLGPAATGRLATVAANYDDLDLPASLE